MKREEIETILRNHKDKYFVKKIGLFGSYARDQQSEESDIDILVNSVNLLGSSLLI